VRQAGNRTDRETACKCLEMVKFGMSNCLIQFNIFPDKRVLAGMVVIWTCKNKIGIGIQKCILSEIQI
jgi:hypothetical protein